MSDRRARGARVTTSRGCLACLLLLVPVVSAAQAIDSGVLYRVFLKDGRALPSYGEYTQVEDRLIFVLPVGDASKSVELQLMSVPMSAVDLERTSRYAEATRARRYASGASAFGSVAASTVGNSCMRNAC